MPPTRKIKDAAIPMGNLDFQSIVNPIRPAEPKAPEPTVTRKQLRKMVIDEAHQLPQPIGPVNAFPNPRSLPRKTMGVPVAVTNNNDFVGLVTGAKDTSSVQVLPGGGYQPPNPKPQFGRPGQYAGGIPEDQRKHATDNSFNYPNSARLYLGGFPSLSTQSGQGMSDRPSGMAGPNRTGFIGPAPPPPEFQIRNNSFKPYQNKVPQGFDQQATMAIHSFADKGVYNVRVDDDETLKNSERYYVYKKEYYKKKNRLDAEADLNEARKNKEIAAAVKPTRKQNKR